MLSTHRRGRTCRNQSGVEPRRTYHQLSLDVRHELAIVARRRCRIAALHCVEPSAYAVPLIRPFRSFRSDPQLEAIPILSRREAVLSL